MPEQRHNVSSDFQPTVGAHAKQRRWFIISVLVAAGLAAVTLGVVWQWSSAAVYLPEESEVESMTAEVNKYFDDDPVAKLRFPQHVTPEFRVPTDHIPKILVALTPARRDWMPAGWPSLGRLKITCKNGKTITVDLYQTQQAEGAFSVHPDDRSRNAGFVSNYFRGGTVKGTEAAIVNAHADFKSRQHNQ